MGIVAEGCLGIIFIDKYPTLPYTISRMPLTILRFALSLSTIAAGIAVLAFAGSKRRVARDPALRLLKIPIIPDLLYTATEAAYLAYALARLPAPAFLEPVSECVQLCLGFAYVLFAYRSLHVNGLSTGGYIPLAWFAVATAVNLAVFAARYHFPANDVALRQANKIILAGIFLYAGACAVVARRKKVDFYPSTKGGFWMAFFCLAYVPFIGLAEIFSIAVMGFDPGRSMVLQAFPARELIVLMIFAVHIEPLYSRLWGVDAAPALSARESEIASLMRKGLSNAAIAAELNLSLSTVKTHVRNVLRKRGVSSRGEIAKIEEISEGDAK